jgi:hypothetical protein
MTGRGKYVVERKKNKFFETINDYHLVSVGYQPSQVN